MSFDFAGCDWSLDDCGKVEIELRGNTLRPVLNSLPMVRVLPNLVVDRLVRQLNQRSNGSFVAQLTSRGIVVFVAPACDQSQTSLLTWVWAAPGLTEAQVGDINWVPPAMYRDDEWEMGFWPGAQSAAGNVISPPGFYKTAFRTPYSILHQIVKPSLKTARRKQGAPDTSNPLLYGLRRLHPDSLEDLVKLVHG